MYDTYAYVCIHVRIIYQKIVFECQKKSLLPELILESELKTENWNRKPKKLRRDSSLMALTLENLPHLFPSSTQLATVRIQKIIQSIRFQERTQTGGGESKWEGETLNSIWFVYLWLQKNLPNHGQQSFILCPVITKSYTQSFTFISNYYDIH